MSSVVVKGPRISSRSISQVSHAIWMAAGPFSCLPARFPARLINRYLGVGVAREGAPATGERHAQRHSTMGGL